MKQVLKVRKTKQRRRRTVFKLVLALNSDHILRVLETVKFGRPRAVQKFFLSLYIQLMLYL